MADTPAGVLAEIADLISAARAAVQKRAEKDPPQATSLLDALGKASLGGFGFLTGGVDSTSAASANRSIIAEAEAAVESAATRHTAALSEVALAACFEGLSGPALSAARLASAARAAAPTAIAAVARKLGDDKLRQRAEAAVASLSRVDAEVCVAEAGPPNQDTLCEDCGVVMAVDPGASELFCGTCGRTERLEGVAFDASQFHCHEGQKGKSSGSGSNSRHWQLWNNQILALEPRESLGPPEDVKLLVAALKKVAKRHGACPEYLMISDIRDYLSELQKSLDRRLKAEKKAASEAGESSEPEANAWPPKLKVKYKDMYSHSSLILKLVSGTGPPTIPYSMTVRAEALFNEAVEALHQVRAEEGAERRKRRGQTVKAKEYRRYYPFFAYKIYDHLVPPEDWEKRRVLFYIYLQGEATLRENDRRWRKICARIDGLEYRGTDPAEQLCYAPWVTPSGT